MTFQTGIIGFPRTGKTSLFKILTKVPVEHGKIHGETHVGIAKVPDSRLERLAELYHPRKTVHAAFEYEDLGIASFAALRPMDAFAHVVRTFSDPAFPPADSLNPKRDVEKMEFDFLVNDLDQIENRMERVEKEWKHSKKTASEMELELLRKAKAQLEKESPLRKLEITQDERKRLRGFTFLSQKPLILVLNVGEEEIAELDSLEKKYGLEPLLEQSGIAMTAVCGKVEAELAEMEEEEARSFLESYGLKESGLERLIRKTYELCGFISFFTVGEDECRAWTIPEGTSAVEAAGTIHSDLARHFIRAETIRWDELLEAGSEANAKAKGKLRLEGKEYVVQDGDVLHIRH